MAQKGVTFSRLKPRLQDQDPEIWEGKRENQRKLAEENKNFKAGKANVGKVQGCKGKKAEAIKLPRPETFDRNPQNETIAEVTKHTETGERAEAALSLTSSFSSPDIKTRPAHSAREHSARKSGKWTRPRFRAASIASQWKKLLRGHSLYNGPMQR